jgi:DNA-binding transcriptional LysR family regulator
VDIELLRTFLTVTQARHFGRAADNLFLTPAAVSARIRQLEQTLGVRLFHRTRGNIQMTSEGEQLLPHAQKLLTAWAEAQEDLALTRTAAAQLRLGCPMGLWPLLQLLLNQLTEHDHGVLSLQSQASTELHNLLIQRRIDLALLFEAPDHPDLASVQITALDLALCYSGKEHSEAQAAQATYLTLDWGAGAGSRQQRALNPRFKHLLVVNDLSIACRWLSEKPAYAYLPIDRSELLSQLSSAQLQRVTWAPDFTLPIYLSYRLAAEKQGLLQKLLRQYGSVAAVNASTSVKDISESETQGRE